MIKQEYVINYQINYILYILKKLRIKICQTMKFNDKKVDRFGKGYKDTNIRQR